MRTSGEGIRTPLSKSLTRSARAPLHVTVNAQWLSDLFADGKERVQRHQGILQDHGDLTAAYVLHLTLGLGQKVLPAKPDFAPHNACRGREQA